MLKPISIEFSNIGSFKNASFTFVNGQASLIEGSNVDNKESQESNGAGKSFLLETIYLALMGEPLRKVPMNEVIRNGEKESQVTLLLKDRDYKLSITRRFYRGTKSSTLKIEENGIEKTDFISILDGTKWILEKIGISREDLSNYFLISKSKYESFFQSSDTTKKKLINRFSKGNIVDGVDDEVKFEIEKKKDEITLCEKEIARLDGQLQVYQSQLEQCKDSDFEKEKRDNIEKYNNEIIQCEHDINQNNDLLSVVQEKIEHVEQKINNLTFDDSQIQSIEKQIELLRQALRTKNKELNECKDLQNHIQAQINGTIECPNCHHNFLLGDKEFDLQEAKDSLEELNELILGILSEINEIDTDIKKQQDLLKSLEYEHKKYKEQKRALKEELSGYQEDVNRITLEKQQQLRHIETLKRALAKEQEKTFEDRSKEIKKTIKGIEKDQVKLKDQLVILTKERQQIEIWLPLFKRFKTHLANKSIKAIEGYTNLYLQKIKSNLQVEIDGYKELANGKTKEAIDIRVLRDGVLEGSIEKFSGGEKARIEMCLILALQQLINLNAETGLDLLCVDEVIEGVDSLGMISIMNALNELNQTIYIISHNKFEHGYSNKIIVRKENGESKILNL